ncbi:MAG: hypothetical protein GXD23_15175 [Comamonadaceae bacterium]|jgi:hypothetical protein|uniref:hypothetical protein n=1 Tax=Hydrogenophaga sp. PML113 TaxID=1899350 RepID=UPI000878BCE0|nr:hypothetical protein [Hydrogenophaga sp. PML113]NCT98707.1 hypothetical protein [Comamonadaceae bacterium]
MTNDHYDDLHEPDVQTPSSLASLAPMLSEYTSSEHAQLQSNVHKSSGVRRSVMFTSLMRACLREPRAQHGDQSPPEHHALHEAHRLYGDLACALVRLHLRTHTRALTEAHDGQQVPRDAPNPTVQASAPLLLGVLISPYWHGDYSVREFDLRALLSHAGNNPSVERTPLAWALGCELMLQRQLPTIRKKGYRDTHLAFSLSQTSGRQALTVVLSMDDQGHSLCSVIEGDGQQRFMLGSLSAAEVALQCAVLHTMGLPPIINRGLRAQAMRAIQIEQQQLEQAQRQEQGRQSPRLPMLLAEYSAHTLARTQTDAQVFRAMEALQEAQMSTFAQVLSAERDSVMQPAANESATDPGLRRWVLRQLDQGRVDSPRWCHSSFPQLSQSDRLSAAAH